MKKNIQYPALKYTSSIALRLLASINIKSEQW